MRQSKLGGLIVKIGFLVFSVAFPNLGLATGPGPVSILPSNNSLNAVVYSSWGHVLGFDTGWVDDSIALRMDFPLVNPGRCKVIDGGYALDSTEPGNHLHQAAIMGAFFNAKPLRVIVQGCVYDKPRIVGVGVQN
jgi:hypothetical protein